jgi:GNAT superfamily N-acetyltransferase
MALAPNWRVDRRGPKDLVVEEMVASYVAELLSDIPDFDLERASPPAPMDFEWPNGCFLLLMVGDEPIGCGAIRRLSEGEGELRRMWVTPLWRGRQAGRYLLGALEDLAREMGMSKLCLDTNSALEAALGLYRSAGFIDVEPYNDNSFADVWLAKDL